MADVSKFDGLVEFVRASVAATGRGCETFRLQSAGFSKAFIEEAKEEGLLESVRGRTGGVYLFGEVPEAQDTTTLKGEAMALLESLVTAKAIKGDALTKAQDLLGQYTEECKKRSEAKKKKA